MYSIPMANWLGESNGASMLYEILMSDVSKKQARAAVTTFCILFNIEVDTEAWDRLIWNIYSNYNSWFDDVTEMDNYFAELLV